MAKDKKPLTKVQRDILRRMRRGEVLLVQPFRLAGKLSEGRRVATATVAALIRAGAIQPGHDGFFGAHQTYRLTKDAPHG